MSREWLKASTLLRGPKPKGLNPLLQANEVLRSGGAPLDAATRSQMESRFGKDFSQVRVHADTASAHSARSLHAQAYTFGKNIVFGKNSYAPNTDAGKKLLAHELAHVVQHGTGAGVAGAGAAGSATRVADGGENDSREVAADRVADAVASSNTTAAHRSVARLGSPGAASSNVIHRKVQMRDVGKGEQSAFAKLPELLTRLNAVSGGLTFRLNAANDLTYEVRLQSALTEFDRQMMAFIDKATPLPLRLANKSGLQGSRAMGFTVPVSIDGFDGGYLDVDDFLASDDLNFQTALVHVLAERAATRDYARRIGTFVDEATGQTRNVPEFERAHKIGLEAETPVVQDFFGDTTIKFLGHGDPPFDRVWRNSRRDVIRERITSRGGLDVMNMEVTTHDGRKLTAEEYKRLLREEPVAQQVERERLQGATEHREGGRSIPAP